MANFFPTKGNLILAKNTLELAHQGYELLDKKRNVLIKEIMDLDQKAQEIQTVINKVFKKAYKSLEKANIENGVNAIESLSYGVEQENNIKIKFRSIMGVEIPVIEYKNSSLGLPFYGFGNISSALDEAVYNFNKVKDSIIVLSVIENAAYRLALNIKKTQKRANALKNVIIPMYEKLVKDIQEVLEERERDEFTRLKVIKKRQSC